MFKQFSRKIFTKRFEKLFVFINIIDQSRNKFKKIFQHDTKKCNKQGNND